MSFPVVGAKRNLRALPLRYSERCLPCVCVSFVSTCPFFHITLLSFISYIQLLSTPRYEVKMVGLTKARRVAVRKKKALLKFWSQPSKPERPVVGGFDRLKRSKKLNPNQTPKQRRDCLSSVSRPDGSNTLLTQALEQGAIEVSSRLFLRLSEHSQWQGESQLSSTGSPLTRASKRAKL
jgi:hypothetical protein